MLSGGIAGEIKQIIPEGIALALVAFAVKRFGGPPGSIAGGVVTSSFAGESWSAQQYGIAIAVAMFAPRVLGRFIDGSALKRAAWGVIRQKLIWTELIARSPAAVAALGEAEEGEVRLDPSTGQASIFSAGRWQAMQGDMSGTLVSSSELDGLVGASSLDGDNDYGYGHILPSDASPSLAIRGAYTGTGSPNMYHAAYSSR